MPLPLLACLGWLAQLRSRGVLSHLTYTHTHNVLCTYYSGGERGGGGVRFRCRGRARLDASLLACGASATRSLSKSAKVSQTSCPFHSLFLIYRGSPLLWLAPTTPRETRQTRFREETPESLCRSEQDNKIGSLSLLVFPFRVFAASVGRLSFGVEGRSCPGGKRGLRFFLVVCFLVPASLPAQRGGWAGRLHVVHSSARSSSLLAVRAGARACSSRLLRRRPPS